MDTFWLILAIVIVGALIIGAINRDTHTKVVLAEQERQDKLNSPEYQAQARASLDYFEHLGNVLDYKVYLTTAKLRLFDGTKWFLVSHDYKTGKFLDKDYFITSDKKVYQEGKNNGANVKLISPSEFTNTLKLDVRYYEKSLEELEKEYKKKQTDSSSYRPENLGIIKTKYELDAPLFGDDWVTSSWQMYEEKEQKLRELEHTLKLLRDPKTRKHALSAMEQAQKVKSGELNDDELLQEAIRIVVENDKASISLLQRQLRIGYTQASRLIEQMEEQNIIGPADGAKPRRILISKED